VADVESGAQGPLNLHAELLDHVQSRSAYLAVRSTERIASKALAHGIGYASENGWSVSLDWLAKACLEPSFNKTLLKCYLALPSKAGRGDGFSKTELVERLLCILTDLPEKTHKDFGDQKTNNWCNAAQLLQRLFDIAALDGEHCSFICRNLSRMKSMPEKVCGLLEGIRSSPHANGCGSAKDRKCNKKKKNKKKA